MSVPSTKFLGGPNCRVNMVAGCALVGVEEGGWLCVLECTSCESMALSSGRRGRIDVSAMGFQQLYPLAIGSAWAVTLHLCPVCIRTICFYEPVFSNEYLTP